jgi:hypothetical protein
MKNAKATVKGWVNPKTGELLKAQKMTQEKADELNGVKPEPAPALKPKRTRKPKAEPVVEAAPAVEVEEVEPEPEPVPTTRSFLNRFTN